MMLSCPTNVDVRPPPDDRAGRPRRCSRCNGGAAAPASLHTHRPTRAHVQAAIPTKIPLRNDMMALFALRNSLLLFYCAK